MPEISSTPEVSRIRTVVIDDHPFFREGLVGWLNSQPGFVCCGEAGSAPSGLTVIGNSNPDLVLLDLQLLQGDGFQVLEQLATRTVRPLVIVISRKEEDVYATRAIRAGARGYVMKEEAPETLLVAIRTVLGGGIYLGSKAMSGMFDNMFRSGANPLSLLQSLSNRELQVFDRLGRGFSSKAVASDLGLSVKTVETYREALKKKLNLPDSLTLVRAATLWHQENTMPEGK